MYEVECLGDRVRVFENGKQYIELDTVTPCDSKNYLVDHYDFLEILKELDQDSLEKILSCYNADYNGVKYRKDKVGDFIKTDKGQLTFEL